MCDRFKIHIPQQFNRCGERIESQEEKIPWSMENWELSLGQDHSLCLTCNDEIKSRNGSANGLLVCRWGPNIGSSVIFSSALAPLFVSVGERTALNQDSLGFGLLKKKGTYLTLHLAFFESFDRGASIIITTITIDWFDHNLF